MQQNKLMVFYTYISNENTHILQKIISFRCNHIENVVYITIFILLNISHFNMTGYRNNQVNGL